MAEGRKIKKQDPAQSRRKFFTDEKTKSKIHRHLTDINDLISDEDIRNVKTDISSTNFSLKNNEQAEEKKQVKNDIIDDKAKHANQGDQVVIPYNILGS